MIAIHTAALLAALALPAPSADVERSSGSSGRSFGIVLVAGPGDGLRGDRGERRTTAGARPGTIQRPTSYAEWPSVAPLSEDSLEGVRDASDRFEARLARCEQSARGGIQGCVADSLQGYASDLADEQVVLPAPAPAAPVAAPTPAAPAPAARATRSIPVVIRQTARRVRAAPSVRQASVEVEAAAEAVRQPIQLIRVSDELAEASVEAEARTIIAEALETAQATLERASGL